MSPSSTAPAELSVRCERVLQDVLQHSSDLGYAGYNKHDGLNSPLLQALCGFSRWTRIAAIQLVMRAPVNLRPLLGVPRTRNPKGQALFASAWLDRFAVTKDARHLEAAVELLDWLLENPSTGYRGLSWGYPYPWQDLGFFQPRNYPNRVVTCWIGFAFCEAARVTGSARYLEALPRIAEFLTQEPRRLYDDEEMLCLSYVPDPEIEMAVIDVPALVAAFLVETDSVLGSSEYQGTARRLMAWVSDKQTSYGAWHYTEPPGDSLITHDNYHTAIILDCFDRYAEATGDQRFEANWRRGLDFYRDHHFTAEGAPRWMHDGTKATDYPFDIHSSASAILCFVRAARRHPEYLQQAILVLEWTLRHLYSGDGRFFYQKRRWTTKRFLLLRWANGWMSWALSSFLRYSAAASNQATDQRALPAEHAAAPARTKA